MLKPNMFSMMTVNETCAGSNLKVEYLPDLYLYLLHFPLIHYKVIRHMDIEIVNK
jgi:hypothetical protein